jgi:hypothetical protein
MHPRSGLAYLNLTSRIRTAIYSVALTQSRRPKSQTIELANLTLLDPKLAENFTFFSGNSTDGVQLDL